MSAELREAPRGHAIVVGGTGMLRAATMDLARQGFSVSAVARGRRDLVAMEREASAHGARLRPAAADYCDLPALRRALDEAVLDLGPPAVALLWIHSAGAAAKPVIAQVMDAAERRTRVFDVLGSASADPSSMATAGPSPFAAFPRIALHEVVLGFVMEGSRSRWLTHAEISNGVLASIRTGARRSIVGTVEPWSARP